jgi:hypothetical protein
MAWADVALNAISEDLDLGIFYAPGTRGTYKPILRKLISVEKGSIITGQEITATTQLFSYKPQARVARTEDANQQARDMDSGSCGIEKKDNDNIDESFQLLIVGHGPASIRWIRPFGFTVSEDFQGDPAACVDEIPFNEIRFDGVGAHGTDLPAVSAELALKPLQHYTSNVTVPVEQEGIVAIGVGHAESIVTQEAADRVAEIIATKQAEAELRSVLPPILSHGEALE